MHAKGSVTFGGIFGGGAIVCNLTTDDGHKYHFAGGVGYAGSPTGGYGVNFEGEFPGLNHILGSCAVEVAEGALGPGGAQLTFFDLHGQIGTLVGYVFGGGAAFGIGGGSWTDAEHVALTKAAGA